VRRCAPVQLRRLRLAGASPGVRLNDFDETLPGPFEWDLKRLAASLVVAGRDNGFTNKQCRKTTLAAVESYRTAMRGFASQTILAVWYAHSTSRTPWPSTGPR
jgi:hypothetical protein